MNSIHLSVTGLQTLIDNLLESASIQAGSFRIRRRSIELDQVVSEALQVLKPLFDRRRQTLMLNECSDIPTIEADPTRLTQVLVNLLSNASKYSPIGESIALSIRLFNEHLIRVEVTDRGPGISSLDRENIFHRFVRLSNPDDTQYGVGLGLSVVKTIIEQHGGEVGVDDNYDRGSIFWFTIPLNGVVS
jgi:two-component system sensor histidine kinase KdpD